MSYSSLRFGKNAIIAGAMLTGLLATLVWLNTGAVQAQPAGQGLTPESPNATAWKDFQYQESGNCALCHAGPNAINKGAGALDLVLMAEYSIWKTHDKHAQAYAVLEGTRGQQMEKILGVKVTEPAAGCLNCHAMGNLKVGDIAVNKYDGVSCGGCHGPSSGWFGPHVIAATWRKKTAEEKFAMGLRDLRDPIVRAELCYSCHVGNAAEGKVVTHAMFAAGHPPLPPIELATFSRNEPQHWRDAKDVPYFSKDFKGNDPAKLDFDAKEKNYHLKDSAYLRTKFALVGAAIALRDTMRLAADRADASPKSPKVLWPELLLDVKGGLPADDSLKGEFKGRWPEIAMATSDCYACHHDLKFPGFRQVRGFGYTLSAGSRIAARAGRPLVRMWPTALVETCTAYAGNGAATTEFEGKLKALAAACDVQPFGEPGQIQTTTRDLATWADGLAKKLNAASYTRESVQKMMQNLCSLYEPKDGKSSPLVPDYESAKQIASLLAVAYEDYRGAEPADPKVEAVLNQLSDELNLQPYIRRQERGKVILGIFQRLTMQNDPKAADDFSAFVKSLGDRGVDQAKLEGLITNQFLNVLRTGVDPKKFTDELVKNPEVTSKLQKLSDEEETNTLRRVADYDPDVFKGRLKELSKLLK